MASLNSVRVNMDEYAVRTLLILENSTPSPKLSHVKIPQKSTLKVILKIINLQWTKEKVISKGWLVAGFFCCSLQLSLPIPRKCKHSQKHKKSREQSLAPYSCWA